jgi:hypothetical protein
MEGGRRGLRSVGCGDGNDGEGGGEGHGVGRWVVVE